MSGALVRKAWNFISALSMHHDIMLGQRVIFLFLCKHFIFCFVSKGKENSNSTTVMEDTFQEADSTLHSRHRKRSRSAKVTSSILSTGNIKVLFFSVLSCSVKF